MIRGALAAVVWSAAMLMTALVARADACSDTWFYAALAATGERDLNQYMGEGGTQTAKSDFDIVARNMDLAGRTVDACKQPDTIAKFAFTDAARWQIGFDRGWITAPIAARRVHSALRRLKAINFDSRDAREYNSVQIRDKALYRAAGLAWEPVR